MHFYYCPFRNVSDQAIQDTQVHYQVKYGDPQYNELGDHHPKEHHKETLVLRTRVNWYKGKLEDFVLNESFTYCQVGERFARWTKGGSTPFEKMRSSDTLIVDGHGASGAPDLYAGTGASVESLTPAELAVQLAADGLSAGHVKIKFAVCHSGGKFDGDEPRCLARLLARELGALKWDTVNCSPEPSRTAGTFASVLVGGFQGTVVVRNSRGTRTQLEVLPDGSNVNMTRSAITALPTGVQMSVTKSGLCPNQECKTPLSAKLDVETPGKNKLVYFDKDGKVTHKQRLEVAMSGVEAVLNCPKCGKPVRFAMTATEITNAQRLHYSGRTVDQTAALS